MPRIAWSLAALALAGCSASAFLDSDDTAWVPMPELPVGARLEVDPLVIGDATALLASGFPPGELVTFWEGEVGADLAFEGAYPIGALPADAAGVATLPWVVDLTHAPGEYAIFQATGASSATNTVARRADVVSPPGPGPWPDLFPDLQPGDDTPSAVVPGVWMDLWGAGEERFVVDVRGGEVLSIEVGTSAAFTDDLFGLYDPDWTYLPGVPDAAGQRWAWEEQAGDTGAWQLELYGDYLTAWGRYDLTVAVVAGAVGRPWYADQDGDGFGDPATEVVDVVAPDGAISTTGDCDDGDATRFPGALDVCEDGADQDCDGWDRLCHAPLGGLQQVDDVEGGRVGGAALSDARDLADAGDLDGDGFTDLALTDGATTWWVPGPVQGVLDLAAVGAPMGGLCCIGRHEVDGIGDVDGDGVSALLLTNYQHVSGVGVGGAAFVVDGAPLPGWTPAAAEVQILAEAAGDQLGIAVSGGWDASGDGFPDFAVGADGARAGGAAYLFTTPRVGVVSAGDADAVLASGVAGEDAGFDVDLEGDLDADGLADLAIGTQYGDRAYVVAGPVVGFRDLATADAILEGPGLSARRRVAHAGDTDGDGHGDLLVSDPDHDVDGDGQAEGAVRLLLGPVGGVLDLALADAVLEGPRPDECLGESFARAGDLDADTFADVMVGASCATWNGYTGLVYLVAGPLAGSVDLQASAGRVYGELVGGELAPAGDVDQDGFDDAWLSTWNAAGANAALVYGAGF